MRIVKTSTIARSTLLALALAGTPAVSLALGLGDITLNSYLNQPLDAEVELLDVQGLTTEDIRVRLATQEAFDRLGVERAYFLTSINFEVVVENGVGRIELTTSKPLLEPYLDFLIETRWPDGRLLREYTVLVDLPTTPEPVVVEQPAAVESTAEVMEQESSSRRFVTPATRPDRNYDREAEGAPRAGGRYLVESNDTLWEIASAAAPEGASIEQTMLATVQMNADAFMGGNINGLKAGYVLELPAERDILNSRREAFAQVAQQNDDWRRGIRRAPALRVVADDPFAEDDIETDDSADNGALADAFATDGSEDDSYGLLDSDSPLAGGSEGPDPVDADETQAMMPASDNLAGGAGESVPSSELIEIQTKLTELSSQVGTLRELVAIKDQQIAALEAQLAEQRTAVSAPPPMQTSNSPTGEGYPWWLFALGGVALLGIGAVVYTRRAQRPVMVLKRTAPQQEPPVARPSELEPVAAAPKAPSEMVEDGERGYGRRLHNDYAEENAVADAVAEADIYVAYGRFQQAINLLESAVKSDPSNPVPLVKMVEIFCKTDRLEEARETLDSLGELGDDAAYGDAAAAIREAEANGPAMDLGELADPPAATGSTSAVGEQPAGNNLSLDGTMDGGLAGSSDGEASQSSQDPMLGRDLDLDLDLDTGLTPAATAEPEPDVAQELADTLDMDLDLAASAAVEPEPEEDALVYASDADPMDTQLDLARAYIDMGDEEGARPVLDEIIAKGDLRQQAEARELLVSID